MEAKEDEGMYVDPSFQGRKEEEESGSDMSFEEFKRRPRK